MKTPPDWSEFIKPTKDEKTNDTLALLNKMQKNVPIGSQDWVIKKAYEQASSKNPVGNRDAALALIHMLRQCVREENDWIMTPTSRAIIDEMFTAIIDGADPVKAMFLKAKKGQSVWVDRARNNGIVVDMSIRVDGGMKQEEAAEQIKEIGQYLDSKTGEKLKAKTILNIWVAYKKNPHFRITFDKPKPPD